MTQHELEQQLCDATGETLSEIRRHGFSLTETTEFDFDPEPYDRPHLVDWDVVEQRRNVSVVDPGHLIRRAA